MRTRVLVASGVFAVVAYAAAVGWRGVLLVADGRPVAVAFGLALLVFPVVGLAAVGAEIRFGLRSARLAGRLADEGGLPPDELPRTPSGRVVRAAADADFDRWRVDVTASPADWRVWSRLALAYDAAGDRRRARGATRQAIALARPPGSPRGPRRGPRRGPGRLGRAGPSGSQTGSAQSGSRSGSAQEEAGGAPEG